MPEHINNTKTDGEVEIKVIRSMPNIPLPEFTVGLKLASGKTIYQRFTAPKPLPSQSRIEVETPKKKNLQVRKIEPEKKPRWYEQDGNFTELVNVADGILTSHPNARLFSLGQSPAWVIHTAAMLSEERGESRVCDFIAFSGRFMQSRAEKKQWKP